MKQWVVTFIIVFSGLMGCKTTPCIIETPHPYVSPVEMQLPLACREFLEAELVQVGVSELSTLLEKLEAQSDARDSIVQWNARVISELLAHNARVYGANTRRNACLSALKEQQTRLLQNLEARCAEMGKTYNPTSGLCSIID